MSDSWRQYKLLVWKNCIEYLANPIRLVLIVTSPILFGLILVLTRHLLDANEWNPKPDEPVNLRLAIENTMRLLMIRQEVFSEKTADFEYNAFVPQMIIGYAPGRNAFYKEIMEQVESEIAHMEFRSFETCEELRVAVKLEFYFAGVCFLNDQLISDPLETNYTLYFPETIRIYNPHFIGFRWFAEILQDPSDGFHFRPAISSGTMTYVDEGFVSLQHFISMACILKHKPRMVELPDVVIQRFSYKIPDKSVLMQNLEFTLPWCIMIAFAFPVMFLTTSIVKEKESKLKLIMNLMNTPNWVVFCARSTVDIPTLFLGSVMLVLLLTVAWDGDSSLFQNSNISAILFLMFAYNVATACFCFFISTLIKNTTITPLLLFFWILTLMPYILLKSPGVATMTGMAISLNCLMGLAFSQILKFEKAQYPFSWMDFFKSSHEDEVFSVGILICLLFASSIFYAVLGLYFDGMNTNLLQHLAWFFKKCIHRIKPIAYARVSSQPYTGSKTEVYEIEPEYKTLTVQITKLSKDYFGNRILNNVSLNMYEGEITVLRGHNGCGKSVLIKMITGLVRPTSGTITIHNCDRRRNQSYLGICLSGNVLFNGLSVSNQLYFFSCMKGMNDEDAQFEVEKYLHAMDLVHQRNVLTEKLTEGLRQYLAVCCALAGESSIVILEEPSSQMDISATRLLYKLLNDEKKGRTILMTTHSLDETEAVADRVAIMSDGKLRCSGSPYFLKEVFGREFRLNCRKGDECDTENVTEAVRKFVPDISPEYEFARELCYLLDNKYIGIFPDIINALDEQAETLDLKSYSISESTLEDIFYHKGVEFSNEHNRHRYTDVMNGKSNYIEEYNQLRFLDKYQPLSGFKLWINVARAIFLKQFIFDIRNSHLTVARYTLPIALTVLVVTLSLDIKANRMQMINYSLRQYTSTITIQEQSDNYPISDLISQEYMESIFWIGVDHKVENTQEAFSTYIIKKQEGTMRDFNRNYIVAATIGSKQIVAWYNDYMLHSAPLSLNLVHNAILRVQGNKNQFIAVNFEPVDCQLLPQTILRYSQNSLGKAFCLVLTISIFVVWIHPVIYIVRERRSDFYFLQISTGVGKIPFWLFTFFYWTIQMLLVTVLMIIGFYWVEPGLVGNSEVIGLYFWAIMLYGISMNVWNYVVSTLFTDSTTAYTFLSILNFTGSIPFIGICEMSYTGDSLPLPLNQQYLKLIKLLPSYIFYDMLSAIYDYGLDAMLCKSKTMELMSETLEDCECTPACCDDKFREKKDIIMSNVIEGFWKGEIFLCFLVMAYKVVIYIIGRFYAKQNEKNKRCI